MDIETLLSIIGIATLISVYIIFVTWWSLNKRAKFAKELDEYLGNDSNPECYKRILFISFENSSLSFVFVRILLSRLKRRFEMNSRDDTNEVIDNITSEVWEGEDECTKEQKKEFMKLMLWCISLYVSRSPISSIIVILLVMIWAIAKLVSNGLKVNSVESGLSEFGKSLKTH